MTPAQVSALLVIAKSVDDRVVPDDARAVIWNELLAVDMPFEFARNVLMKHYGTLDKLIMPAHFNQAWEAERRARDRIAETNARLRELDEPRDDEMSPETRAALDEFWRKRGGRPKRKDDQAGDDETDDES